MACRACRRVHNYFSKTVGWNMQSLRNPHISITQSLYNSWISFAKLHGLKLSFVHGLGRQDVTTNDTGNRKNNSVIVGRVFVSVLIRVPRFFLYQAMESSFHQSCTGSGTTTIWRIHQTCAFCCWQIGHQENYKQILFIFVARGSFCAFISVSFRWFKRGSSGDAATAGYEWVDRDW